MKGTRASVNRSKCAWLFVCMSSNKSSHACRNTPPPTTCYASKVLTHTHTHIPIHKHTEALTHTGSHTHTHTTHTHTLASTQTADLGSKHAVVEPVMEFLTSIRFSPRASLAATKASGYPVAFDASALQPTIKTQNTNTHSKQNKSSCMSCGCGCLLVPPHNFCKRPRQQGATQPSPRP